MSRSETRFFTARSALIVRRPSSPAEKSDRPSLAWRHGHGPQRPRDAVGI